jgi:hypothetical protein
MAHGLRLKIRSDKDKTLDKKRLHKPDDAHRILERYEKSEKLDLYYRLGGILSTILKL